MGFQLKIDPKTLSLDHGFYARVLIDVDMAAFLPDKILVTGKNKDFFVKTGYKNLPKYCANLVILGQNLEECRRNVDHRRSENGATEIEKNAVESRRTQHAMNCESDRLRKISRVWEAFKKTAALPEGMHSNASDNNASEEGNIHNSSEGAHAMEVHLRNNQGIIMSAKAKKDSLQTREDSSANTQPLAEASNKPGTACNYESTSYHKSRSRNKPQTAADMRREIQIQMEGGTMIK